MKVSQFAVYIILLTILVLKPNINFAQTELIEVDSVSKFFSRTVPIDKPFTIKYKLEKGNIKNVYYIKNTNNVSLDSTIILNMGKDGFIVSSIDKNDIKIRKEGNSRYAYITFNKPFFKPGDSYFIITEFENVIDENVFNYMVKINKDLSSKLDKTVIFKNSSNQYIKLIENYESSLYKLLKSDKLTFGFMSSKHLEDENNFNSFLKDTNFIKTNLNIDTLIILTNTLLKNLLDRDKYLSENFPNNSFVSKVILAENSLYKDEIITNLLGKDGELSKVSNLINYSINNKITYDLVSGLKNVNCLICDKINESSFKSEDILNRIKNLDTLIIYFFKLRNQFYLIKSQFDQDLWKSEVLKLDRIILELNESKKELISINKVRLSIDKALFSDIYSGFYFSQLDVLSGSNYMTFEARNKLTLVPEFGVVTSAFSKKGKELDYGIIPYFGFSINFMGINKDVKYNSYKKDWRQKLSFGIGWSLVNLNKEAKRASFFEKGSLLTGFGFRINNTIKATSGVQMYFDLSKDNLNNEVRKMAAVPYIGLSFDLSIKDFLGGFLDIIPGIGKTKNISSSNNNL